MSQARDPGVYHLILHLAADAVLRIGRLGRFTFPSGYYVYTGSAMNGLGARLARHRRRRKKLRWHIDCLLLRAELVEAVVVPTRAKIECTRNRALLSRPRARIVSRGFGSSDCRCPAHLVYFGTEQPHVPGRRWTPRDMAGRSRKAEERI